MSPQLQHLIALWLVLISHPTEGGKLSWPEWLITYQGSTPAHPSTKQAIVLRPGNELNDY